MEKIPTAEDFLSDIKNITYSEEERLITFAKMHVEAALKEAKYCRTKECIQKCYSLDKIE